MDFGQVLAISGAGMDVERARLDAAAMNLANMHTTRTAEGGPYKPVRVVSTLAPTVAGFSDALAQAGLPTSQYVLETQQVAPRLMYEPNHPDADTRGFVAYPGVDSMQEMVNVMTAVRAYEANVMVVNAAKAMSNKALDIGSGS